MPIKDADEFANAVAEKTLKRPFIKLVVTPDGKITGRGLGTEVTGNWYWEDGYFCRDLFWGDRELGYNCQEVSRVGDQIRFQSDKGTGDYADFSVSD